MSSIISREICIMGLTVGLVATGIQLTKFVSIYYVDNSAYIPEMIALDSVIILLFYNLRSKPIEGDIWSGLSIVACAVALYLDKLSCE
ncbi:MAG: hypothetical protein KTR28_00540 [Micavibrio sp.]|nr:hypothetical protein [Micavibrio sp.]